MWRGWWARHNYKLGFLGDYAANLVDDGKYLEFVELAAFAALMAAVVRQLTAKPRRAVAPDRVAKAAKARRSR
jgi:hypothetical protein